MNKKEFIDSIPGQHSHLARAHVARIVESITPNVLARRLTFELSRRPRYPGGCRLERMG